MDVGKYAANFVLANQYVPAIIWGFAGGPELAKRVERVDVSVWVVRNRAFVYAAPLGFVAGNSPPKRGEPFLLVRCAWPAEMPPNACAL